MKYKTEELEGELLDAAVDLAEGRGEPGRFLGVLMHAEGAYVIDTRRRYSTSWEHAGPIIEREMIHIECVEEEDGGPGDRLWAASCGVDSSYREDDGESWFGETPLIAAMRAYVAHKLGREVELPD